MKTKENPVLKECRPPEGLASRARGRILGSRNRFWKPDELPGSSSTAQHLLIEMHKTGDLMRIRKGLYWRGISTPLGMAPPPLDVLSRELVGTRGVGPAGLSASNQLRLSTQVPRKALIAVPARPPRDVGPIRFASRAARTGRSEARLNGTEVAVLEALDGWGDVIEVPVAEAWERLKEILGRGDVRLEKLVKAAKTEPAPARARLRSLLDDAGYSDLAKRIRGADARTTKSALRELVSIE